MPKIAIIDDDVSVRNSIEIVLKAHGHAAVLFSDPKNFLETAALNDGGFKSEVQHPFFSG